MVNKLADLAVTTFLAEQIKNVRVAVIGDVMLDRYFQGEVKRISPEAPVPVTRITKINSVLGGERCCQSGASGVQGVYGRRDGRR